MFRIMVVEDDVNTRKYFTDLLADNGYEPIPAEDGAQALTLLDQYQIDLIVLDVMMPHMNGLEFSNTLREGRCMLPILMVSALETQADKQAAFLSGTDDYMVKPVNEQEFLLRIAALLRRSRIANERKIQIGRVTLNYDTHRMTVDDCVRELPRKEFLILFHLLSYPDKLFTKRQLMDQIWDMASESDEHTIEVHIGRLREHLRDIPEIKIVTVRGLGYKAMRKEASYETE